MRTKYILLFLISFKLHAEFDLWLCCESEGYKAVVHECIDTHHWLKDTFILDHHNRLIYQSLPDGVLLSFTYDDQDRLKEVKSSDQTVHVLYDYLEGQEPVQMTDLIHHIIFARSYDAKGHLIYESNNTFKLQWNYDTEGRCTSFKLPDNSSLHYSYNVLRLETVSRKNSQGELLYEHSFLKSISPTLQEELLIFGGVQQKIIDCDKGLLSLRTPWHSEELLYGQEDLVCQRISSLFGTTSYVYDDIHQLTHEGSIQYRFDAARNPLEAEIGPFNQLLSLDDCSCTYDARGNLIALSSANEIILYRYDALNRLIEITWPGIKNIRYTYDPFSRLYSKRVFLYQNDLWEQIELRFYLHDGDKEIGSVDEKGRLLELKVAPDEMGFAAALELNDTVYLPLHDVRGSIISLVSSDKTLLETYEFDAFGREQENIKALSPWRFRSKRHEEGLIFFGSRFYHPRLMRWLTPDPLGSSDGPNYYAFMHNAPINYLDRYGLLTELPFKIFLPLAQIPPLNSPQEVIHCEGSVGEMRVDWAVSCGFFHKLHLEEEEVQLGTINLAEHISDLTPSTGTFLGLLTYQNGIKTSLPDFLESCRSITENIPEGTLLIGLHNKTKGLAKDILRLLKEVAHTETPIVDKTKQFLGALAEELHSINPQLLWGHILHSEAGAISRRAIEGLSHDQQELLKKHLFLYAIGPMLPIPMHYAFKALNIYSKQDFLGIGGYLLGLGGRALAQSLYGASGCSIDFIPCLSSWGDRSLLVVDHAFLGSTYALALQNQIQQWRKKYRLYDGRNP